MTAFCFISHDFRWFLFLSFIRKMKLQIIGSENLDVKEIESKINSHYTQQKKTNENNKNVHQQNNKAKLVITYECNLRNCKSIYIVKTEPRIINHKYTLAISINHIF